MHYDTSNLEFFNGFGGFAQDGREYEIILEGDNRPPAPWINVIANKNFGFTVSETGAGLTWAYNSRENKITPWSNDPVSDRASEAIYIRDMYTGRITSPMSLGRLDSGEYRVRHGFGYSVFHHEEGGLKQQARVFVPVDDTVKVWEVTLENTSGREMHLTLTYYVEWVLGVERNQTNPYIVTAYNNKQEYLSAENVYNQAYRSFQGFIFSSEPVSAYTADRQEILGRGGSTQNPLGLAGALSHTTGVGLDSCGAISVTVRLLPGEQKQINFGLGYSDDEERIRILCRKYKHMQLTRLAFDEVQGYWENVLGTVSVQTSDRAIDLLANGWLMYQTISCRLFARTAFYQNGGAFGFRDQLQDGMALVYALPEVLRGLILEASEHQFVEGDVQHWWHPPSGVGVRTRITDDLLWMPYITSAYITATGDYTILQEETNYIEGPQLADTQHDMMFVPEVSQHKSTLYEHCKKAIQRVGFGEHGLPLIGGGDWNDGMDRVGVGGQGESVWLGWFVWAVMDRFIPLAMHMKDIAFADTLHARKVALKESLEENGWDGAWYLRAFYDDGTKMGSSQSVECKIDSISQSWSILSGAGAAQRTRQAFDSAWEHLVLQDEGVSLLLTPPFDKTPKNPGYIKNYYPGIRENGGQYTHGAIWLAIAAVLLGKGQEAHTLFSMLNPILHAKDREGAVHYEKEPYVMTADVAYKAPYTGRGGWSWYTGSSGWMYQGLLKYFLGLRKEGDSLVIASCVPEDFGDFTIRYRYKSALYIITVRHDADTDSKREESRIKLRDDGQEHHIVVDTACAVTM